jgi:1-aminocyclopropane-1-carboxylate deaminase/D-cysteine desulfhydrase-like pyridoxal-dependent ACC family enzyme
MQDISLINITTDTLSLPLLSEKNIEADVLRLDKIHPLVSGNKNKAKKTLQRMVGHGRITFWLRRRPVRSII